MDVIRESECLISKFGDPKLRQAWRKRRKGGGKKSLPLGPGSVEMVEVEAGEEGRQDKSCDSGDGGGRGGSGRKCSREGWGLQT